MIRIFQCLTLLVGLLGSVVAYAGLIDWTSTLDAAQETHPVDSSATGNAIGTIDTDSGEFTWSVILVRAVAGQPGALSGEPILAHFHNAPAGSNGGVVIDLFTASTFAASYPNGATFVGSSILDPGLLLELLADNFYINIHTAANPAGEIRGQVLVSSVPEPGTLGLLSLGLVGLVLARRKRA